jgi:hypothetical protein
MSQFQETLDALREARSEGEMARAELHRLRLRQLALLRAQKRADRQEIDDRPETQEAIAKLRSRLDAEAERLREIEQNLRDLARLAQELRDAQAAVRRLEAELANLPREDVERRDLLAAKLEEARSRLAELERRVRAAHGRQEELERERERLQAEIDRLESDLEHTAKDAPVHVDHSDDLRQDGTRIRDQKAAVKDRDKVIRDLITRLFEQPPQKLIEEWNDATPIILLPLRLETRFKETDGRNELWVRVFPDEIAVNSHEKLLTEREQTQGMAYWKELRGAATDAARKTAWQTLAKRFGANRGAWVALQTKPTNWSTPPPKSDDDLEFPEFDATKPDTWTEAPHSRVIPDRFVLMAYRGSTVLHTLVGQQVDDILVLGPAPLDDDGKAGFKRNPANNRLDLGEDFRWIADFPLAVERGMGFRVPLSGDEATRGFDQLLVIGLKLSADETESQHLVEELIQNHHYSAKGFSLVRQGTATNNTDDDASGFGAPDWQHDLSYFVETGAPLFQPEPDGDKATDGQRLADYLGLDYATLQNVYQADATDHAEAVAMNRALYSGTLGYYLHSMLNEVMSDVTIDRVRELFTGHVTGRGPLPAVRVGNQPYGILLTSAFPKWSYARGQFDGFSFEEDTRRILLRLMEEWQTRKGELGHIGKGTDARASLLKVLGLQPTSADYYQRVGYSYDYLRNEQRFAFDGEYGGDVIKMFLQQSFERSFLSTFGYQPKHDDGTAKPAPLLLELIFQHYHTRLDAQNLIDALPLSEERLIKPYQEATGRNYIDWLISNAGRADQLEAEDFGPGVAAPTSLLYLMLHFALLQEGKHSIFRLLAHYDIAADELVRSRKFMNLSAQPDVSHWEIFRAPANRILAAETSDRPLLAFVQLDRFARGSESEIGRHFAAAKEGLAVLSKLPTARLERLLAEHIDTLNYRLDSWQTALFDERARAQRELDGVGLKRRRGLHLGSYGYLENVSPKRERRVRVPDDSLPVELREGVENVFTHEGNGGYVHTPSMNHATAAAILRNGYLTHATPEERERLTVNLSSERVRRAKYLIDGVRHGQTLEALLGYLFERGLHDWTTRPVAPVFLDQFKPDFRQAFPIKRTKVPREGIAGELAEVIEQFSVVNGLDLARTNVPFPYGIAALSSLETKQVDAIKTEKLNLENSLDALRDVLTAECAYQLSLGNFERAGAVMRSISGGELPVEIEVIRSSRGTDLSFTNRVVLHFDPALTANPWPAIPHTRRARTEPAFNHWVAGMLGDPDTIRCMVRAVDTDGNALLDGGGLPIESAMSFAELGLQPLDLVFLIGKKIEASGFSELESRVRYRFARQQALDDTTIVKIEFANAGGGGLVIRSFAEILPLANAIRDLAGKARPLHAQDFAPASKLVAAAPENPGNIDVAELQSRVEEVRADFDLLFASLGAAADKAETLPTETSIELLRSRLVEIADAGFVHAFPLTAFGFAAEQGEALVAQSRSLQTRYATLTSVFDGNLVRVNAATARPPQQVAILREMTRSLLGDDFVLLPKFTFSNVADVVAAHTDRDQLMAHVRSKGVPLPVEEWLHGAALVRPNLHTFGIVSMLSQTFEAEFGTCSPIQLPFRAADSWLGVEFPAGTEIVHDTIAIVQCLPQGFSPAGTQCGLLIDEWTEALPKKEEVTGIAFNYDAPNSAPPSAILLAITPEETGSWRWENLVASVLDTFERAKLRAVEPDMIDHLSGIATLLPSTIAEFTTGQSTIGLDYARNVALVQEKLTALASAFRKT